MQPRESDRDGALCRVLDVGQERCVHLPFGRMIAAELTAELLPQKFFRPGRAGIAGLAELLDARLGQLRGALLASRNETLQPHLREDEMTALEKDKVI